MANTNTDLTEEDAADLQFPKGRCPTVSPITSSTLPLNRVVAEHLAQFADVATSYKQHAKRRDRARILDPPDVDNPVCSGCSATLVAPFIHCDPCSLNVCAACFSSGSEFATHRNDHAYRVMRDDFHLFQDSDWTAREEVALLESLLKLGNWGQVARQLPGRSERDCREHYDYFYLSGRGSDRLPRAKETAASLFPEPLVPYRLRMGNTEDPPRYQPHHVGYHALSGYNAARSDFEVEYDRSAEALLAGLQEIDPAHPHYETLTRLQCGIVGIYNRRLAQRRRTRQVVRNHGLISYRRTAGWLHRYEATITRPVYARLLRFMQFCSGGGFESLMEGLHRSGEIKLRIFRLCGFRSKGLTTLAEAKLYHGLHRLHDRLKKEVRVFQADQRLSLRGAASAAAAPNSAPGGAQQRRRAGYTPIEILGMPGYDRLSAAERELCRTVRLVPASYIEFKNTLVTEAKKCGFLKLQLARKLLKIDVNKTRRLYDFLIDEGYIERPPS